MQRALSNILRLILALFLTLIVVVVIALGFIFKGGPTFTYRYRLTIEVDTPQGIKSGSSVIETTLQDNQEVQWGFPESRRFTADTRGEAPFIDLGENRHLVALLVMGPEGRNDTEFRQIVPGSLGVRWDRPDQALPALHAAIKRPANVDVPLNLIPTLVTFRRLDDPDSAEVVPRDAFARIFGPGYSFHRATVEMVPMGWWPSNQLGLSGAPLTRDIEQKIPAILRILNDRRKRPQYTYPGDAYKPAYGQFKRVYNRTLSSTP